MNQTSSDEDEENEQNSLLRRRLLGRHISNSQNQQTSQSKTQKKQKIPIISLTESISPSRDKSSKSSRNSTSKSLKDSSSKLKSPIGTEIPLFTPTKKKSSLSPQISLSSPHKRKSPQNNPQISPKKVKPPKIENSVSRRFISLVSPRKIRTRSQSRRHERTQSTPPRSHSNANILEENPLEGTSRSTSYPSILPKKKKPKVAEADSTTSDVPLFPNERVANTIRRETSNILNAPLMNLDAMRRYQQHLLDFRRLQNMSEIVNDSFISIDSLDPLNDYHHQNQQNEDDHEFNRTRNFRFSYELDGTFNVTPSTNNSGSSHNNPDDNDDNSSNTRNRRSNERPLSRSSDQNMNSRENQDSHSGQRFEDSNPYQMETSRPPDPADGSESTICYDNLADLLNKDLYIERPVWHGYSFGTGAYNREGTSF